MSDHQNRYFLYFAVISVNLLAFSLAGAFSWGSPTLPKLTSSDAEINPLEAPITVFEEACVTSILFISSIIGSTISIVIAELLGRKKTLIIMALPMLAGYALMAFATKINLFYIARFMLGITVGTVLSVLPSYVGEIAEDENRGILGAVMGISVAVGHLFTYAVGPFLSVKAFSLVQLVPLILFYITFVPFVPESPYYLLAVDGKNRAEKCLKKLRGGEEITVIQKELIYIEKCVKDSQANKTHVKDMFKSRAFVKGLTISVGLQALQQLSGIGAVLAYMQTIFESSGSTIPSSVAPIPPAVVQIISNIIIIFLVDRLGRKPLLIISGLGNSLSLISLGTYFFLKNNEFDVDAIWWLPICSLIIFFFFFNMGFASLPWTISGEIFSPNVKSLGSSISSCSCLITVFLVTLVFPYISIILDMSGSFWLFSGFTLLSVIFVVLVLPETKGISNLEIQKTLEGGNSRNEYVK
ncbi:facilitated trehalose transporter Tret1 [Leptinotarsa decemlineata]|uniref:facilitated trehalose transporter Tret1 n=1 Tax=Leptinotarsa decemlineata TaxID=7539 RepID=UPI003D307737